MLPLGRVSPFPRSPTVAMPLATALLRWWLCWCSLCQVWYFPVALPPRWSEDISKHYHTPIRNHSLGFWCGKDLYSLYFCPLDSHRFSDFDLPSDYIINPAERSAHFVSAFILLQLVIRLENVLLRWPYHLDQEGVEPPSHIPNCDTSWLVHFNHSQRPRHQQHHGVVPWVKPPLSEQKWHVANPASVGTQPRDCCKRWCLDGRQPSASNKYRKCSTWITKV